MKEYSQEDRINRKPCPYCGFWHSAASHPPQFNGFVFEIQGLESELEQLKGDVLLEKGNLISLLIQATDELKKCDNAAHPAVIELVESMLRKETDAGAVPSSWIGSEN